MNELVVLVDKTEFRTVASLTIFCPTFRKTLVPKWDGPYIQSLLVIQHVAEVMLVEIGLVQELCSKHKKVMQGSFRWAVAAF